MCFAVRAVVGTTFEAIGSSNADRDPSTAHERPSDDHAPLWMTKLLGYEWNRLLTSALRMAGL